MNLYWLEQTETDVPAGDDWLSASEMLVLGGLRFPKRRRDWRLGRWTAKCAVAAHLNLPANHSALRSIEIRPAPSGAPEVFLSEGPASIAISLSHSAGTAVCAITPFLAAVGCDLEVIEARGSGFLDDYFTAEEQSFVMRMPEADRSWLVNLLWSAKESALKALQVGLRADTRSVRVSLADSTYATEGVRSDDWLGLRVDCNDGKIFRGWWRRSGNMLRTVVADPPPDTPVLLRTTEAVLPGL